MIETHLSRRICTGLLGALLLSAAPAPATDRTGIIDILNKLRAQSCGAPQRLKPSSLLDNVAGLLARGIQLREAQRRAGYHATKVLSLELSGVNDEQSLARTLGRELCAQLSAPGISDIGAHREGANIWVVLGQPFNAPEHRDSDVIARQVLELTNEARSHPRSCGGIPFPAAPALQLSTQLSEAAREHSKDMARHGYMDHTASDGSTPADRVARTGYPWRVVGENLASGISSPAEVVASWLASAHHCANIMGADYHQMGVAYAVNFDAPGGVYWTQVLAAPRP
jgi:uncharacterized protein YkwD